MVLSPIRPILRFPFYRQYDSMDCGPACLRMIAKYYGRQYTMGQLRDMCYIDRGGVSLLGIAEAADNIGLRSLAVRIPFKSKGQSPSLYNAPLPAILHWNQNHFVVAYKVSKRYVNICDPATGKRRLSIEEFQNHWLGSEKLGIALLIERTIDFQHDDQSRNHTTPSLTHIIKAYISPQRKLLIQLAVGMIVGSLLQLLFPFLTQAIVDVGIDVGDINFITLILIGQLMLFIGNTSIRFIQSWIILHVSTRININVLSG